MWFVLGDFMMQRAYQDSSNCVPQRSCKYTPSEENQFNDFHVTEAALHSPPLQNDYPEWDRVLKPDGLLRNCEWALS